ncbi:MAG TPA: acetate--CoA ligase family protein [Woeseiaceae bacterium]|nr:acetate--CoA ligase family protein [Woeseiaceae bacterium]
MTSNTPHRLDPLLRPRHIAVLGASARPDSLGDWSLRNVLKGGFPGPVYPVNPRYRELAGLKCYGSLGELPEVPDLVIFGVADTRVEALLAEAIALGVPAAVLMSPLVLDDDTVPNLKARVQARIREAGMLVCGANGMGFYNVRDRVWACGFDSRAHEPPGNVTLISHSGSGMCGIVDCDERLRINLAVSTGFELGVTMDEYMDFALDLPETRAIGLFVETARSPEGFRAALEKASAKGIPVVALKVGRTERAARLTVSHSGAMAGDDATYDALFDRYGVHRVRDMDELATTLILFAELPPPGPGGLVCLHDSGGERQLMVDLADEAGVELAELSPATVAALESLLDPGLPAVNPLDAWSRGGEGAGETMSACLATMMQDPNAAMGVVAHDRAPEGAIYPAYIDYMKSAHAASGKPVALVAARQGTGSDRKVIDATHAGFPILDGLPTFLRGVRALFEHRDRARAPLAAAPTVDPAPLDGWRRRLAGGETLLEYDSLALLAAAGMATIPCRLAESEEELVAAGTALGYPVALKSAAPGLLHKSDRGGVRLDLRDSSELVAAWRELRDNLGPRAVVARMAGDGVEMLLGARFDPQFGPVVLLGFGGIYAEILEDVAFLMPPFDTAYARRRMDRLKLRPLLDGRRGRPPCDVDAFARQAALFSAVVHELRDEIEEVDVNPVIVTPTGCVAVDALIVGRRRSHATPAASGTRR